MFDDDAKLISDLKKKNPVYQILTFERLQNIRSSYTLQQYIIYLGRIKKHCVDIILWNHQISWGPIFVDC